MFSEELLYGAKKHFAIIGPPISEKDLLVVFPTPFPGRGDLIQFYSNMNGGSRTETGSLIHCGNPAHRVARDRLHEMRIEGFFSISLDESDRMLPFAPMLRQYASAWNTFGQNGGVKTFLQHHRPVAFDHSGNDVWIDLESGHMRFMDWDKWEEGSIEISSSFIEFVTRFWVNAELPNLE